MLSGCDQYASRVAYISKCEVLLYILSNIFRVKSVTKTYKCIKEAA